MEGGCDRAPISRKREIASGFALAMTRLRTFCTLVILILSQEPGIGVMSCPLVTQAEMDETGSGGSFKRLGDHTKMKGLEFRLCPERIQLSV